MPRHGQARSPHSRGAGRRRPLFVLVALLFIPALLLAGLELALRVAGVGYSPNFFLKTRLHDHEVYIENQDFGRRFFPKALVRSPAPVVMPVDKPPHTRRVFVLGESAALGDPEPAFGFGRYLEVLLGARYPGTHFEVVCTAMTAINSHAILPLARECARRDGDLWVVYMGNNEVVGPFGAGTVLSSKTPALSFIRLTLTLKMFRLGQVLGDWTERWQGRSSPKSWQGMKMFLEAQTRPSDAERVRTEDYFRKNLRDILRAALHAKVPVVLCTLGSNLKDCAPFASLHAPRLAVPEKERWEKLYRAGQELELSNRLSEAASSYSQASALDPSFAELQFRLGRASLALTNLDHARYAFTQARDWDALPFRATSSLNQAIRLAATESSSLGVYLADVEQGLAGLSPAGVPGNEFFYEHVHLNFNGNYQLARLVAEQATKALPELRDDRGQWLAREECENRLAVTDWDRLRVYQNIVQRETEPPFTLQLDHNIQLGALQQTLQSIKVRTAPTSRQPALDVYQQALGQRPDDFWIRGNLAKLYSDIGDPIHAGSEWQRVKDLLPGRPGPPLYLGRALMHSGNFQQAEVSFREVLALRPDLVEAHLDLGATLIKLGRTAEGSDHLQTAARLAPGNKRVIESVERIQRPQSTNR